MSDTAYTLAPSEYAAMQSLLAFQGKWGVGPKTLTVADVPGYLNALANLAQFSYPAIVNATIKGWLDAFYNSVVTSPTSAYPGQTFAAMYIVAAYQSFVQANPNAGSPPGPHFPTSFCQVFFFGQSPTDAPGVAWGQVPAMWRPTAPSIWQSTTNATIGNWVPNSFPTTLIMDGDAAGDYLPGPAIVVESIQRVLNGWSDFPNVAQTSYGLWNSQVALVNAFITQQNALDADTYLFLLHVLIGMASGNIHAQGLANQVVAATASSTAA
jgi:hypothetical protein